MIHDTYMPADIDRTAFFAGHRNLKESDVSRIAESVYSCIYEAYLNGYRKFYSGCALGFDTIAAYQTIRFRNHYSDVILSLAVPCATQADRWSEKDRTVYRELLQQADEIHILSPDYYHGAMLTRNRYMADRSSLCICYLIHMNGGTASSVRYASLKENMRIINLAIANSGSDC